MSEISIGTTYEERMGIEKANKTKQKLREQVVNGIHMRKGKNETKILNDKEKTLGKIKREEKCKIIGYKVDGCIPKLNLVIEVDEPYHYNTNWKNVPLYYTTNKYEKTEKGKNRHINIEKDGYKFLRINEQKYLQLMKGGKNETKTIIRNINGINNVSKRNLR